MMNPISDKPPRSFQFLLFAMLGFLLIALFSGTAWMDARRTQETLMDVFENKGLNIIETVETISGEKLRWVVGTTGETQGVFQDIDRLDEGFRMQEAILGRLIDLAREVDQRNAAGGLSPKDLTRLATEAALQSIVVYDQNGRALRESAPVSAAAAAAIRRLTERGDDVAVDPDERLTGKAPSYLVTVRRKNHKGFVALILDAEGFRYWAERVAIQSAIEESGWRKGVHYFMVIDSRGVVLAGAGRMPIARADGLSSFLAAGPPGSNASGRRIIEDPPESLEVYALFTVHGRQVGIARIGLGIEDAVRLRQAQLRRIILTTGLMMLAAVLAMGLYYRLQGRHLRKLQEMKEALYRAQRLSALGKLAAGLAHEIRNPLNAVGMAVQRIQREFEPSALQSKTEFSHLVTVVREEIGRLNQIVEDFLGPARVKREEFQPRRLGDFLEQVVRLVREEAASRSIRMECRCQDPDVEILMDSARLHQALLNLTKNAMEAIEGSGAITIAARLTSFRHAAITIQDSGVGIGKDEIEKILNYEYTTKEKGLGIGLPIAKEIIQAHGGELRLESVSGRGTLVEVILPVRTEK